MSRSTLTKWESGDTDEPRSEQLRAVADALAAEPGWLMGDGPDDIPVASQSHPQAKPAPPPSRLTPDEVTSEILGAALDMLLQPARTAYPNLPVPVLEQALALLAKMESSMGDALFAARANRPNGFAAQAPAKLEEATPAPQWKPPRQVVLDPPPRPLPRVQLVSRADEPDEIPPPPEPTTPLPVSGTPIVRGKATRKAKPQPTWTRLAAGGGIELERVDADLYAPEFATRANVHIAEVRGESMERTLLHGDIAILEHFPTPLQLLDNPEIRTPMALFRAEVPSDSIVVLAVGDEAPTLKRIKYNVSSRGVWYVHAVADNAEWAAQNGYPRLIRISDHLTVYAKLLAKGVDRNFLPEVGE